MSKKEGYRTIFERDKGDDTYRERLTEQGLDADDIRRRDEEATTDRVHTTSSAENSGGKTFIYNRKL